MRFFLNYLRQKVPQMGKETPLYFRQALVTSGSLLSCYYALCFFFFPLAGGRWEWIPPVMIVWAVIGLWMARRLNIRQNLLSFSLHCFLWVVLVVLTFGWGIGVQHFLTLLLIFVFFNVYEKPLTKVLWFLAILAVRIFLFDFSQSHPPVHPLTASAGIIFQTINTVTFFLIMAGICIIFSSSIQQTERQLRLRNQTLYREAGTDSLTGLPNRRALVEEITRFQTSSPDPTFSVAIADIDWFKRVNDSYGHSCGDYTLVKLTELFVAHSAGQYSVCRWGGEEFCFFLPHMNLDRARDTMVDLALAVEKMELNYEGATFSITLTIGVEETDFSSPLEDLLNAADKKLYMGKTAGRNRVVA